jgi:CubicO group peptidase (beta-lactamase class C family)
MYEKIENYISSVIKEREIPGSSVAIVKDREIAWSKGFGYASLEEKTPATPDTVYRYCSITKPFVTTGLLQLLENGKFNLDDPVNDHLEEAKIKTMFAKQPTIRDLLTHYSGLPTIGTHRARDECDASSTEEYIAKFARAIRPPGQVHGYSNPGFIIMGHLIEHFSGTPYPVYMKENVIKPLEMDSSDFYLTPSMEGRMSTGYGRRNPEEPVQRVEPYASGITPPAASANLFSTCTDFAHFIIAQMNEGVYKGKRILKEETLKESHRLQAATGNSRSGMGLSWFRFVHDSHVVIRHTCGMLGWTSHVAFYPDLKTGVVWNTNLNDGSGWRPLALTVLRMASGKHEKFDPKATRSETVPDEWRKIAGTYGSPDQTLEIKVEDGNLVLGEGGGRVFLEKIEDLRYLVHGGLNDGLELTFEYDEKGRIKQFDLGANVIPRYLTGFWRVIHTTNPLLFDFVLDIESEKQATAINADGKKIPTTSFKVEDQRIMGTFQTTDPQDVIGLSTTPPKYNVTFELQYIEDVLVGRIELNREKATVRVPGKIIILSRT